MQAKLLPAHDMEDSRAFTRSERILLDHQKLKRMSAVDLRDLIRDVLHNPEFNASEVDHDMHCCTRGLCAPSKWARWIFWTCGRTVMASRMSDFLRGRWRLCCTSCWQTSGWRAASTLRSKSIRTPRGNGYSEATPMVPSRFNWPRRRWVRARCRSP